jgi:replicative DNA helicase
MTRPQNPILSDMNVPFSQEAEQATIGAVLVNPSVFVMLAAFLKPEDFYLVRHQYIWKAMYNIQERNEPLDLVTVAEELTNTNKFDEMESYSYLIKLSTETPSSINAEAYARLVERTSVRRRLMQVAEEIKLLAQDEQSTLENVIADAEAKLFGVSDSQVKRSFTPLYEGLSNYYDHVERLTVESKGVIGVPSGFTDLDQLLGGFQRSDLLVFAGRPGMGKTAWMLSAALNSAKAGARVAIFTMEMGVEQIVQRIVAMESGINVQNLRLGRLSTQEKSLFTEVVGRLSRLNIYIDDTPALSPLEIRTKARRLAHEHGLDIIIVDYMQLMNAGKGYENNRVQEISYISRSLKELARELNVPLISAAQLSRAVEQRNDKRPVLSDLRESGSIEQDADIVMFLYRDEVYNEATEFPNQADIIVAKHRNGPTGTISLYFEKSLTKFTDAVTHRVNFSDL